MDVFPVFGIGCPPERQIPGIGIFLAGCPGINAPTESFYQKRQLTSMEYWPTWISIEGMRVLKLLQAREFALSVQQGVMYSLRKEFVRQ